MSTVSEIVVAAFREGNFIAVGETPTDEEKAEALPRLRSMLNSLFGVEIGEAYRDWYVPSSLIPAAPVRVPFTPTADTAVSSADSYKYPPPNSRLLVKTTTALTLYFPANPADGARMMFVSIGSTGAANITLNGNGHLVDGLASKTDTVTNLNGKWWFYRADLGSWVMWVDIAEDDDNIPLPEEFDDLLICGLAIRFSARFQVAQNEATVSRFSDMLRRLKKRYAQSEEMPQSYNELKPSAVTSTTAWML